MSPTRRRHRSRHGRALHRLVPPAARPPRHRLRGPPPRRRRLLVGNAGWLTPALTAPLPEPAVSYGLRAVLSPSSPVYRAAAPDPRLLRFPTGFARHSTARHWARGMRAYAPLNQHALAAFDDSHQRRRRRRHLPGRAVLGLLPHPDRTRTAAHRARASKPPGKTSSRSLDHTRPAPRNGTSPPLVPRCGCVRPALPQPADVHGRTGRGGARPRRRHRRSHHGHRRRDRPGRHRHRRHSRQHRHRRPRRRRRRRVQRPVRLRRARSGAWLGDLARPFGVRQPVQAGRGYSFSVSCDRIPYQARCTSRPNAWRVPRSPRRTDRGSGSRA